MRVIGAKTAVTEHLRDEAFMPKENFKEIIFRDLAESLSTEILKGQKLPIPNKRDDVLTYYLRFAFCSVEESVDIRHKLDELELYKELAGDKYKNIIEQRLNDKLWEKLT